MTLFALILALGASAPAQQDSWQVQASSIAVLAADTTVSYRGAPPRLQADTPASANEDFAVVKAQESDGAWVWTILPLSTGTVSFVARYLTEQGQPLAAPPVSFRVEEAVVPKDAEILDIKDPLRARPALWPWLLAATLIGCAWFAWKRLKGRRRALDGASAEPAPSRAPEVIAIEAIEALLASKLWDNDQAAYYLRLTDILRNYLEARYDEPVTAMTSVEISRLVKARAQDLRVGGSVRELLNRADLVKFARAKSSPDEGPRDADLALTLIKETTPPEQEPSR
ncbi:MAG: hypothetical protein AAB036_09820 [Elusimicrobiota bacterium]